MAASRYIRFLACDGVITVLSHAGVPPEDPYCHRHKITRKPSVLPPIVALPPLPPPVDAGERSGGTSYEPRRRRVGREGDGTADKDAAFGQQRRGRQNLEMTKKKNMRGFCCTFWFCHFFGGFPRVDMVSILQYSCRGVCWYAQSMTPTAAVGQHIGPWLYSRGLHVFWVGGSAQSLWGADALVVATRRVVTLHPLETLRRSHAMIEAARVLAEARVVLFLPRVRGLGLVSCIWWHLVCCCSIDPTGVVKQGWRGIGKITVR